MKKDTTSSASASQIAKADSIFKALASTATATLSAKLLFIAPSKHGVRLIVQRQGIAHTEAVYAFKEVLDYACVKVGDMLSILAEKRTKDGQEYWNVTALTKQE